jgi:hypothetical protein
MGTELRPLLGTVPALTVPCMMRCTAIVTSMLNESTRLRYALLMMVNDHGDTTSVESLHQWHDRGLSNSGENHMIHAWMGSSLQCLQTSASYGP